MSIIAWIDVETTGILPGPHQLLEVACVLSNMEGEILETPYESLVKHLSVSQLIQMASPEAKEMHEKSGIWSDLWTGGRPLNLIDQDLANILESYQGSNSVIFGGNSIQTDRAFVRMFLPNTHQRISHHSMDMTSISKFLQNFTDVGYFPRVRKHRALDDVRNSIDDYVYYSKRINS